MTKKNRYAVLVSPVTFDRDGMESGFYKLHVVKVENEQPRNCSHTAWDDDTERVFDDLTFRLYFSWRDGEFQAVGGRLRESHSEPKPIRTLHDWPAYAGCRGMG